MATTQRDKAIRFRALHEQPGIFVLPNPWDAGSSRALASLGFQALATSSFASSGAQGRRDGGLTMTETLNHVKAIVEATDLPVSGDLGDHFSDDVEGVAQIIRLAAEAGLVGCSIEDGRTGTQQPLLEIGLATERVASAVEVARALPFPFTLTARAENFTHPNPSLEDTIKRLVAYERAGADVLFAPALPNLEAVAAVCGAVTKPVNFMAGTKGRTFTLAELAVAGVKRVSLGASLFRAAMTAMIDAARELRELGTSTYAERCISGAEWYALL
ncbi:MAG TPA: isocitrate lyase/phosphoenolpyruvate mutase family protein [Polyangiaceae bacterium]|nr:isocitrate lyase/phosphoenolpyruvate mutase family protein [Polyangiaceae bacterium]